MSGRIATERLHAYFAAVCEAELTRLSRKLNGLAPEHRAEVETITADIIGGIARLAVGVVRSGASQADVDAVARLFALER
jgi:Glutamyl-tRNAGlu reductase, dimerisation domain